MIMYGIFLPFNYISSSFFIHSWYDGKSSPEAIQIAGIAMGMPFIMSAFLVPLTGYMIDAYGGRVYLMIISSVTTILTFALYIVAPPMYGLVFFGFSFSLFAAIVWPAITMVIPRNLVGLGLGLTTAMQNTSMTIFPLVIAYIFNKTQSYSNCLICFLGLAVLSLGISFIISIENKKQNDILNKPEGNEINEKNEFKPLKLEEIENENCKIK